MVSDGVGVHHGVTFNFGSAKVCSPAIFETSYSYDKDIWIAVTDYYVCSPAILETCFSYDKDIWLTATDYYMYFYIIVLFPMAVILQLINFTIL